MRVHIEINLVTKSFIAEGVAIDGVSFQRFPHHRFTGQIPNYPRTGFTVYCRTGAPTNRLIIYNVERGYVVIVNNSNPSDRFTLKLE